MQILTKTEQQVKLIDGKFSPIECLDLLQGLINQKINFHKVQRLGWCIGDELADTSFADERMKELAQAKVDLREFIMEMRAQGKCVRMDGVINITVCDE